MSVFEAITQTAVRYFQPVSHSEQSEISGKEVNRNTIAALKITIEFLALVQNHRVRPVGKHRMRSVF